MSFTEYLQIPALAQRYKKVKKYFFLKESAYDVTSVCQLRCDGCYYFQGEKYQVKDNRDLQAWRAFFEAEKERGITYVVLAGFVIAHASDGALGGNFANEMLQIDRAAPHHLDGLGSCRAHTKKENRQDGEGEHGFSKDPPPVAHAVSCHLRFDEGGC